MDPAAGPRCFLLLLLVAALRAEPTDPGNSTGQNFIVFFPENIASYHPAPAQDQLWVTGLFHNTTVTLHRPSGPLAPVRVRAGQVLVLDAAGSSPQALRNPAAAYSLYSRTLRVSSDRPVVVQAFSSRRRSTQAALILPVDKLGLRYLLPPLPPGLQPAGAATDVDEQSPFRVILINADQPNTVRLAGASGTAAVPLGPGQAARLWLQDFRRVEADRPVAVLLGHPCAARGACSCGLLYAALPPAASHTLSFPVPPALARGAEGDTLLLLAGAGDLDRNRNGDQDGNGNGDGNLDRNRNGDGNGDGNLDRNRNGDQDGNGNGYLDLDGDGPGQVEVFQGEAFRVEAFRPEAGGLKAASAFLYRPGLLLPLIPESSFSSCYLVPILSNQANFIIIVVHKESKVGVHVGAKPLDSGSKHWEEVKGTEYESIVFTASENTTVVWHNSSRIGVYYVGKKDDTLFGHPAASISTVSDRRGCVVRAERLLVLEEAGPWPRAVGACGGRGLELVSLWEPPPLRAGPAPPPAAVRVRGPVRGPPPPRSGWACAAAPPPPPDPNHLVQVELHLDQDGPGPASWSNWSWIWTKS
ncbi:uncharacterized protein ACNS7B_019098 [Menidia menidia]